MYKRQENNNIGWATIQTIIDRGYKNLFYQSKDLKYVDQYKNKIDYKNPHVCPTRKNRIELSGFWHRRTKQL